MRLDEIEPIAQALLEKLRGACVRSIIAGSIRRRKPEPHDIEIVAIPRIDRYTVPDLWGNVAENGRIDRLSDALFIMFDLGEWELDPVVPRNGPKYKRLRHVKTGICCDLFITDARRWGVIATIRTGPGDFSKAMVTYAQRRGMFVQDGLLHQHAPAFDEQGQVVKCPAGERCGFIAETPEERDVFAALGLAWLEPEQRNGVEQIRTQSIKKIRK